MVAYIIGMDTVFKALADPTRRHLLDGLMEGEGQTLKAICQSVNMSRQGVSKHMAILEAAGLVVIHAQGRQRLHYLNAVPIQEIAERWIDKFAANKVAAVTALKSVLENQQRRERT